MGESSRFCLRRAVAGEACERPATGDRGKLAIAILGTTALQAAGLVHLSDHHFLSADIPVLAILAGGLMFGAAMVLARGCAARLFSASPAGSDAPSTTPAPRPAG
jgi:hypothetical protein